MILHPIQYLWCRNGNLWSCNHLQFPNWSAQRWNYMEKWNAMVYDDEYFSKQMMYEDGRYMHKTMWTLVVVVVFLGQILLMYIGPSMEMWSSDPLCILNFEGFILMSKILLNLWHDWIKSGFCSDYIYVVWFFLGLIQWDWGWQ
jgi:hypothetical protein